VTSAIVNDAFVARYFGNRDSIGHRLGLAAFDGSSADVSIVGVAPDIRQSSTESQASFEPILYVPYVTNPLAQASVLVRSSLAPGAVAAQVRERMRGIDANLPLYEVMTLEESFALSDERMGLRVFGTFFVLVGVVALLLATLGLYAVTAYATVQRTREIGIRVALGSRPSQIAGLVAQRAGRHLVIGLSIGMLGALGLTQLLRSVLVGIGPRDLWTLPAVALLLIVVTGVATAVPVRRAMRLNPVNALRNS
jgi:ABC-type antimicrobial peptide transport system permease subunit